MKKIMFAAILGLVITSCQKSDVTEFVDPATSAATLTDKAPTPATPNFNLEVILRGDNGAFGLVKFRQANDAAKIVTLDVSVRNLSPDHEYKLQRAVDTNLDGNCTSTTWLTLGKGLVPQSIFTDDTGSGKESLFRNLSSAASGTSFDIHFQVIDAVTDEVVLTSDCYQFTVR